MPHYLLALTLYAIPVFLLTIPFLILSHILTKPAPAPNKEPDTARLEEDLKKLIENNIIATKTNITQQNLQSTFVHITASYLKDHKKALHGFHLFQLIFALIKNNTEDAKIIKILRRYFPSVPTPHLYAFLKSCKEFLNISNQDSKEKELIRDLNQNKLQSTLLYFEKKINLNLNKILLAPNEKQAIIIEETAKLSLIFASFSQFYNQQATEKILQIAYWLSPDFFQYWHRIPTRIRPLTKPIRQKVIPKHIR